VNQSGKEQRQEAAGLEREGVELETLAFAMAEGELTLKKI
jgi:hypothetical protein